MTHHPAYLNYQLFLKGEIKTADELIKRNESVIGPVKVVSVHKVPTPVETAQKIFGAEAACPKDKEERWNF
jgi:hypothetical protein